jgi:hypothetical protein
MTDALACARTGGGLVPTNFVLCLPRIPCSIPGSAAAGRPRIDRMRVLTKKPVLGRRSGRSRTLGAVRSCFRPWQGLAPRTRAGGAIL